MRKICLFFITIILATILLPQLTVRAIDVDDYTYNYNFWRETVPSAPGYRFLKAIDISTIEGVYKFGNVVDISISQDKVLIVDKTGSQVIITDYNFNLITRITLFRSQNGDIMIDENNKQMRLTNPEGAFEAINGDIYVTDTGYRDKETQASRIIVFGLEYDEDDEPFYYVKKIINKPDNYIGNLAFVPSKIVVDKSFRIFTVIQGGYQGIIELNNDGTFSRFYGTNKIKVNLFDYFWKMIASETQQKQMLTFAPPYNNLAIDNEGFIYATTSDESAETPIKRINPSGDDVLKAKGYYPPIGDVNYPSWQSNARSLFTAIAVNDFGMYAALDTAHNRVFVYNFDGELLFVIGSKGNTAGQFYLPNDVAWLGNQIIVSDYHNGYLYLFEPTKFGELVISATQSYYSGDWEASGNSWLEALQLNSNYDIAYVGYGKMLYKEEKYQEAINYFRLGNNRYYYALAYKEYRSEYLRDKFWLFISPLVLGTLIIIYTEIRFNRKGGKE